MYREIIEKFRVWKDSPNRKPILLKGARQVGKSWVMKEFGREAFANFCVFDFDETPELKSAFQTSKDPHRILQELALYTPYPILPGKTLIIFDEIQLCEEALNSLKYFKENAPEYHVMAAGSLLGVAVKQKHMTVPVGKVNVMTMYPMTFKEFLRESNREIFDYLNAKTDLTTLPEIILNKLKTEFRRYQVCGGMPEAVEALLENKGVGEVDKVLKDILDLYELDFSQYVSPMEVSRIKAVWNSLPAQLSKENRKFIYNVIRSGARAKDYENALQWLKDAGLIYKLHDISKPGIPLSGYFEPDVFKVYALDCGLLRRLAALPASVILDPVASYSEFKGAFAENVALESLVPYLDENTYSYWTSEGRAEIDLIIQWDGDVVPVEVKSDENISGKSLYIYSKKYSPGRMITLSMQNISSKDRLLRLPLSLTCWLPRFLEMFIAEGEEGRS